MKRLVPASLVLALAMTAPAQAVVPQRGLATAATTPAARVAPAIVPAVPLPAAAPDLNVGQGVLTAVDAGAPIAP